MAHKKLPSHYYHEFSICKIMSIHIIIRVCVFAINVANFLRTLDPEPKVKCQAVAYHYFANPQLTTHQIVIDGFLATLIVGLLHLRLLEGVRNMQGAGIEATVFVVAIDLCDGRRMRVTTSVITVVVVVVGRALSLTCGRTEMEAE